MPNVNGLHIGIGAFLLMSLISLIFVLAWRRTDRNASALRADGREDSGKEGKLTERQLDNVAVYEARIFDIDAELAAGAIDQAHYEELLKEAQKELLADVEQSQAKESSASTADISAKNPFALNNCVFGAVVLCLFAMCAYIYLPAGLSLGVFQELPVAASLQKLSAVNDEAKWKDEAISLDQRLVSALQISGTSRAIQPREIRLLNLRAQLQRNLENFSTAESIYRRLAELDGEEPYYAASAIEAKYLQRNKQGERPLFAEDMRKEIGQLWRDFPENPLILSLAGTSAFERNNYEIARQRWQAALAYLPKDGRDAVGIQRALSVAEAQLAATAQSDTALVPKVESGQSDKKGLARVIVSITIDSALTVDDDPATPVFVFARPSGVRMPVAAKRLRLKDLPLILELTDADTMAGASLSDHRELQVAARLSRSGSPTGQSGDLESELLLVPVLRDSSGAAEFSSAQIPQLIINKKR